MKVENLKEAFENLLQNLRWSKYELAINCGISYSTLKSIFDGDSVRVQEGTLRKIYHATGWDFRKDGELTYVETLALNDLLNYVRAACGAEVRWVDKLQNDAKNGGKLSKFKRK